MATSWHYYEAHVTWDPVSGAGLTAAEAVCRRLGAKIADLVLLRGGAKHDGDMFTTIRSSDMADAIGRMQSLIADLSGLGMKLRRYKLEYTLMDSRHHDALELL